MIDKTVRNKLHFTLARHIKDPVGFALDVAKQVYFEPKFLEWLGTFGADVELVPDTYTLEMDIALAATEIADSIASNPDDPNQAQAELASAAITAVEEAEFAMDLAIQMVMNSAAPGSPVKPTPFRPRIVKETP